MQLNETHVLLDHCDKEELKIGEQYKNEDGELDVSQLMDDIDAHTDQEDDIRLLRGILAEIEARVIHEPEEG